jgi:hypothetical protein
MYTPEHSTTLWRNDIARRYTIMGKSVQNPKKFIISCRVNDQEMELLQQLANQSGLSISNLLRQTLNFGEEMQMAQAS